MYKVWAALNVITGTPVNAVWAMAALAFLLGLPMLWSFTVFQAVTSISSVALYTSCECLSVSHALLLPMDFVNVKYSDCIWKIVPKKGWWQHAWCTQRVEHSSAGCAGAGVNR